MKLVFLICIAFIPSLAHSQDSSMIINKKWAINEWITYNPFPVSTSIRGSNEQLKTENKDNNILTKYPSQAEWYSIYIGLGSKVMYSVTEEIDIYIGISGHFFSRYNKSEEILLIVLGSQIGGEYTFLPRTNNFNVFTRLGISCNYVSGPAVFVYLYGNPYAVMNPFWGIGFEVEPGIRYVIPSSPVAIELSGNYYNTNLISKSYIEPQELINTNPNKAENNGAINSYNPRNVDFFQIKLGAKLWL